MLIDLHHPDMKLSEVKMKDIDSLKPFPSELEYSCPSRGSWTIAHTPMIIPGSYMVYLGASSCLRGVVLSAAEYEGLDRFSMVLIEEKDILSGDMEELAIEGISEVIERLDWRPSCVLPFTGCIHYFLATDIEYIYEVLNERFPDIDFMYCQMTPTMKENDHTPEEDMRRSMYTCVDRLPTDPKAVNLIGDNQPVALTGDHLSLLLGSGYKVRDLSRMYKYSEYKEMGASRLNIYSLPVAQWSCECLEERIGQPFIYMPYTYDFDEIERDMARLADTLGLERPDLSGRRAQAEEALARAHDVIGDAPVYIDYVSCPRYLTLAKMLIQHGFNVVKIFGDAITPDEQESLDWLKENRPDLPLAATANFRARFYSRDDAEKADGKLLAIGPKAAYFTGSRHFVNMIENNGWYGFDGVCRLADAMTDAFEHEKDTEAVIQVKGWGCSA
jgi:hypothetical protein